MTLVVLAAGMGSRYGGLKQLDPVGAHGEFIIDYSVYDAAVSGYDKVVFVIKEENFELFRKTIGSRAEKKIDVEYAFQKKDSFCPAGVCPGRKKPWGTAHALLCAGRYIDGPFAVINADDFYGRKSFRIVKEYMERQKDGDIDHYCMAGYILRNTLSENGSVSRGVCSVDENGMLLSVTENKTIYPDGEDAVSEFADGTRKKLPGDTLVSMNFYGFTPSILDLAERDFGAFLADGSRDLMKDEYGLPSVATRAILSGAADLRVIPTPEKWFGVTYSGDKPQVVEKIESLRARGIYPDNLFE